MNTTFFGLLQLIQKSYGVCLIIWTILIKFVLAASYLLQNTVYYCITVFWNYYVHTYV